MSDEEKVADVVWEAPPEPTKTMYDWPAIAEQLRARPGVWAKIFDDDRTSVANAIRQGNVLAVRPELGFQVRTTNNVSHPYRRCSLFMRYNEARDTTKKVT